MFRTWDFERVLLALLLVMIVGCLGFIAWQRSVAEDLSSHMGTAERQLTQIGELAAEIIRLQEEMRADAIASNRTGPLPYIEEQMTASRIGKKFQITNNVDPHPSEGFEDTRYLLAPAQPDYDFTRQEIATFLLHIEGNTTRMKATRIKLDLSTRKNAGPDMWKPTFTITDRKPIVKA
jgi:hypothetical protein